MPTVSVIVPVYQVEAYLPQCIDSILAQSFQDFELILVDDGSPDGSGEICDRYAERDPRIHVLHKKNAGVSCARNSGLELAAGEYVTFCDSDDAYEPEHLEILLRRLLDNGADSAVTSFKTVTEDGTELQSWERQAGVFAFPAPEDKIDYLLGKIMTPDVGWEVCTRLFRRSIIEERHIRFCETCGNFAEDLGFVILYILCGQIEASGSDATYRYLQRSSSMMHNSGRVIKLDQVNEVSKYIYPSFAQVAAQAKRSRSFTILHAAILYNQASKLLRNPALVHEAVSGVQNQVWMKKHLRGILFHRRRLQQYFGKEKAWKIILLSHFLRHQNRTFYRLERSIINRLFATIETY